MVIDKEHGLLLMPDKAPVPVEWRPAWRHTELKRNRDTLALVNCWTAMNAGRQGDGLINGHYLDYVVQGVLSSGFYLQPS